MNEQDPALASEFRELIGRLVFLGFNSRVAALDRATGSIVWDWKCPKRTSDYVAMLLDGDQLMVSVQGYTYCLNPLTGELTWQNPMKGFRFGIPTLVSVNGSGSGAGAAAAEVIQRRQLEQDTHTSSTTTRSGAQT
jgi:outer membrane protein assembly factor BamB